MSKSVKIYVLDDIYEEMVKAAKELGVTVDDVAV